MKNGYILDYYNHGYCIAWNKDECFTDEDECLFWNMDKKEYQNLLQRFGAIQYKHTFSYPDGFSKSVTDSFFKNKQEAEKCLEELNARCI